MDLGTVLDGSAAVKEGLIDSLGSIGDALEYLNNAIEKRFIMPEEQENADP